MEATELLSRLEDEHRELRALLDEATGHLEAGANEAFGRALARLGSALREHHRLEDARLYAALASRERGVGLAREARLDHVTFDRMISELERTDPARAAGRLAVARQALEMHMAEEQERSFALLRERPLDASESGEGARS